VSLAIGAYAKVLLGFLSDCSKLNSKIDLHRSHCLYIVELGAGSGKFSFFMLKVAFEEESDRNGDNFQTGNQRIIGLAGFPGRKSCVCNDGLHME